jgi:thiol-disulfide isomerase/thioredoxin
MTRPSTVALAPLALAGCAALAIAGLAMFWPLSPARAATAHSLTPVLGASTWLNGRPSRESLHGKVVLVDVFTVDCVNCRNVTPNLRRLSAAQRGKLVIIGVHTPETPVERERSHVVASLRDLGITWPVAIDDDSTLWNTYGVEAWPTQLIFDRKGHLRKTIVGDSQDDAVNAAVAALLAEG